MTDVIENLGILHRLGREHAIRSNELSQVHRELRPAQRAFRDWKDKYELGLYREAAKDATKVPSADLREKLALEAMPKGIYETYLELTAKRDALKQRLKDIQGEKDGVRTEISAEKTLTDFES